MRVHGRTCVRHAIIALATASSIAGAQKPPAVRALGSIDRVSTDSLASVATALPMPNGRVFVNDMTARRLLLLDSALAHGVAVADTTSITGSAYGKQAGTLIPYRADTALFIDIASLSMLVLGPTGQVARIMAIPRPDDAQFLIGHIFGTPGFDARGRLAYYGGNPGGTPLLASGGRPGTPGRSPPFLYSDSAFIVRADLATRTVDTAASFKIPKVKSVRNRDGQGILQSLEVIRDPLPVIDDWAVCPDGSIAIVRGRDYHVDWLDANGRWTSFPKMPFDWQRLDDDRKLALIDSTVKADQTAYDRLGTSSGRGGRGGAASGGRGSGGSATSAGGSVPVPNVAGRPELKDLTDYWPPFAQGALRPDADGNLWIRTTTVVKGQPVYDIVNRRGELVDRVQLPPFRTIAGFGPSVVYMAVKDATGNVRLERARVR